MNIKQGIKKDDYLNFIDQSKIYNQFYESNDQDELSNSFLEIDQFINKQQKNQQENTPLIIAGDNGYGKKHLLFNWIKYHQQESRKSQKDIIITHIASAGGNKQGNYFYAIYNILNKLREQLDMNLKIEILEEKLRKYFMYYLDSCMKKINDQIVNDSNIIIIIDGVNQFQDQTGKEISANFWLPRFFPLGVKIILTVNKNSVSYNYFQQRKYQFIDIQKYQNTLKRIEQNFFNNKKNLNDSFKQKIQEIVDYRIQELQFNPLYLQIFLELLLIDKNDLINKEIVNKMQQKIDLEILKEKNKLDEFMDYILQIIQNNIFEEKQFQKLLQALVLTQKGLTKQELINFANIQKEDFELFEIIFGRLLINNDDIYCFSHIEIKDQIAQYLQNQQQYDTKTLHEKVAEVLEKTKVSIRQLEEQIYHLFQSEQYFKLKELISDIEQFLLLYTANNKFQLFRYWQKLEEKGFDPSIEYNKSLEAFEMDYHPSNEDMFQIIFQMSRFLKDFSDFETVQTPTFRHPPILGNKELEQIGLLDELQQMNLQIDINNKQKQIALNEIERLNIDIPSNYQIVEQFFIDNMKKECTLVQSFLDNNQDQQKTLDDSDIDDVKVQYQKIQQRKQQPVEILIFKQNVLNEEQIQSFYYYKRFLWMIFPLACISNKEGCNYSKQIIKCYTSHTQYMSVIDEKLYTKQSILLILEAQLRKRSTYEKPEVLQSLKNYLEEFKSDLNYLKQQSIQTSSKQQITKNKCQNESNNKSSYDNNNKLKIDKFGIQEQSKIHNKESIFLTLDNSVQPNGQNRRENKFKILQDQNSQNHFNSVNVFNKSKQYKSGVVTFRADFGKLKNSQSEDNNQLVLPRLKQQIFQHSMAELNSLQEKNNYFVKEYNKLKFLNQQLGNNLSKLNITKNQICSNKDNEEKVQLGSKIDLIQSRIKNVEQHFIQSNQLKLRMKKIIQICKQNNKLNKVYIRDLYFLLQNLQKLINFNKQQIQKQNKEIQEFQKLNEEMYQICTQRMNNEAALISQIKNDLSQKQIFDHKFMIADDNIEKSINDQNDEEEQKLKNLQAKQNSNFKKDMQKNINENIEKFQDLETQYENLCKIIELDEQTLIYDKDFQSSQKFKSFLKNQQKKDQIKSLIMSKQDQMQSLQQQLEYANYDLKYQQQLINIRNCQNDQFEDIKDKSKIDIQEDIKIINNNTQNKRKKLERQVQVKINIQTQIERIFYLSKLTRQQESSMSSQSNDIKQVVDNLSNKLEFIKSHLKAEKFDSFMSQNNRSLIVEDYVQLQ